MCRRRAYSLVELLVVVALVAVLVGLLVAAVQKVRERAGRLRDENSFRQVALAAHGFHTQHGRLPPLIGRYTMPSGGSDEMPTAGFLLSYLEQPPFEVLQGRQPFAQGHVVPAYTSPLDPSHENGLLTEFWRVQPTAVGNAAFNVQVFGPKYQPCGVIDGRAGLPGSFPDGTSATVLLATKRGLCGPLLPVGVSGPPPGGSMWWFPLLTGHCGPTPADQQKAGGAFFGHRLPAADGTGPTFQVKPSQSQCDPDLAQGFHSAGITVALTDGSVRAVRGDIAPKLWRAGLLPNDGAGLPPD